MKGILTVAATLFCIMSFAQQKNNHLSAAEKKDGWKLLFDGKTTKGWHSYNKPEAGAAWKVMDGILYLDTSKKAGWQTADGGDLVNEKNLLQFSFKIRMENFESWQQRHYVLCTGRQKI